MPPAKSSDRKSDEKHRKEKASAGSLYESSEDETPMFQALEEQPEAATATKNGVSQLAGYTSSFAKDLVRSSKNGPPSIKPNPKFLKKKDQIPAPKTRKSQKSKTPEKAAEAELAKKPEPQKKPKKSEKEQIDQLIEAINSLAEDQHVDNQRIDDRVEQMGQATVSHLNELYMFIKNETKILKDDNKVLKDKIKVLEDKAKKAEAFNNEAVMGKITEVGTAVGDLARSDTPIEESTSVKKTIRELTEEVKKSNRSVAECARIGEKFDNFLRDNQSPRARKDSKRQRRDKSQSPPPRNTAPNPPAPAPIVPTIATPQTGATTSNLPRGDAQAGQVIREGNLATTVMGQNGRPVLQAPNKFGARNRDTNGNNTRAPNGTIPAQNSYANAAASAPTTIPGLNMASQRANHTQNNGGANQASNNSKQPTVIRDDHFKLCPDTGNFQRVERFNTVQTKEQGKQET